MAQILTETQLALKLAVEAETNGEQTIIFTEKGQPSFMYKLQKFDMSMINEEWSGTHPAFTVDGIEKDYIYIGVYSGVLKNGEIVSQPNQDPRLPLAILDQQKNIAACGAGFHMMSYDEWAAVALICRKNNWFPLGVTDASLGYSPFGGPNEKGRSLPNSANIYTGSGTVNFRHNLSYTGISDMVGNVHERQVGCRLVNGELHVIDPSLVKNSANDLSRNSNLWKAVDAYTGALIERSYVGDLDLGTYIPTTTNSLRFGLNANANTIGVYASNVQFAIEVLDYSKLAEAAVSKLQQLDIISTTKYPDVSSYGKYWNDVSIRCTAETQHTPGVFGCLNMMRGGSIAFQHAGIDTYTFDFPDDIAEPTVSCRPCYYE
ncbi:hypothetical protein [Acinetobacter soli]|uniref:hypothetical protein n=1 Tax=Acinetobacter soli TaxID=487316 RepID=UPI000CE3D997|nr:hypothetical protein [Acinetobacter soli]PPB87739.1 hypothetical protein AsoHEU7_03390 [Acinetobacter soli]